MLFVLYYFFERDFNVLFVLMILYFCINCDINFKLSEKVCNFLRFRWTGILYDKKDCLCIFKKGSVRLRLIDLTQITDNYFITNKESKINKINKNNSLSLHIKEKRNIVPSQLLAGLRVLFAVDLLRDVLSIRSENTAWDWATHILFICILVKNIYINVYIQILKRSYLLSPSNTFNNNFTCDHIIYILLIWFLLIWSILLIWDNESVRLNIRL